MHFRHVKSKELRQVPREDLGGLRDLSVIQKQPVAVHQLHLHIEIVHARVCEVVDVLELKRQLEYQRLRRFDCL
jgi:hypothetical protein